MSKLPHISIRKIMDCLNNAEIAYQELFYASGHDQIQSNWANFLRQSGSVIHSLEGACRTSSQLRQWYGTETRKARNDNFLQYMYQARNAEQHNSLPTLGLVSQGRHFDGNGQIFTLRTSSVGIEFRDGKVIFAPEMLESENGERPFLIDQTAKPILMEIFDEKHKNTFPVPDNYKGVALDPTSPPLFAKEYLGYLKDLVDRATKHGVQSRS